MASLILSNSNFIKHKLYEPTLTNIVSFDHSSVMNHPDRVLFVRKVGDNYLLNVADKYKNAVHFTCSILCKDGKYTPFIKIGTLRIMNTDAGERYNLLFRLNALRMDDSRRNPYNHQKVANYSYPCDTDELVVKLISDIISEYRIPDYSYILSGQHVPEKLFADYRIRAYNYQRSSKSEGKGNMTKVNPIFLLKNVSKYDGLRVDGEQITLDEWCGDITYDKGRMCVRNSFMAKLAVSSPTECAVNARGYTKHPYGIHSYKKVEHSYHYELACLLSSSNEKLSDKRFLMTKSSAHLSMC